MPYTTRRKMRRKKRGGTRRPRKYANRRRRRKANPKRKPNIIRLGRQMIPKRAFVTHKFVRYIRIPARITTSTAPPTVINANWNMPPWGGDPTDQNLYPMNTLLISTNDPLAPFNETGTINGQGSGWPLPNTRAFLNVPSTSPSQPPPVNSQCLFDSSPLQGGNVPPEGPNITGYLNQYTSFWRKMQNFYRRFTVVGTKCTVAFSPDPVYSQDYARAVSKHCIFTMGVKGGRADTDTSAQPQDLTEQPGFITREYNNRNQTNGRCYALSMTRKWSARKGFGLSKGDVISNGEICGTNRAQYSDKLHGFDSPNQSNIGHVNDNEFVQHPHSQQYFAFSGNSILTNNTVPGAYEPSQWPSGLIKVTLHYSTVWSSPAFTDNEFE